MKPGEWFWSLLQDIAVLGGLGILGIMLAWLVAVLALLVWALTR